EDIESVPMLSEIGEQLVDLLVAGDVAGQDDVRAERVRCLVHARAQLVIDVGEGQLRAFAMHGVGDAPGDRTLTEDAGDQGALAVQKSHVASAKLESSAPRAGRASLAEIDAAGGLPARLRRRPARVSGLGQQQMLSEAQRGVARKAVPAQQVLDV